MKNRHLHLNKIMKNKHKCSELLFNNIHITDKLIPIHENDSILNKFHINNNILNEYIIKTNTNRLDQYDIAVTNLGTIIYDDNKFKDFILCLDNTTKFTITALSDKIPMLWDSNKYYESNMPTLDYIYFPNRQVGDFNIDIIFSIQFLLYYDYKNYTYKNKYKKRYYYNFIEHLCKMFFKDINNPELKPIKEIIIGIYIDLIKIKFTKDEINNLSDSVLFAHRKKTGINISDIRLVKELTSRINKLKNQYSKNSLIGIYIYNKDHKNHDLKHFLTEYYSEYTSRVLNRFYEILFNYNYIPSLFCDIKINNGFIFNKINNEYNSNINDLYSILSKCNPDIPEIYIKSLFNIESLIRFSNDELILDKSLSDIYDLISSNISYQKFLSNKYKVFKEIHIPENIILHIEYNMCFKNIYYLRVQKILKEDRILSYIINYSVRFPNIFKFQNSEYLQIRYSIFQYLIESLYYVIDLFSFKYKKHLFYYKFYQELKLVVDFPYLMNDYKNRIKKIKEMHIIQDSINIGYILNRINPSFPHSISDIVNSDYYFNITGIINSNSYRIGCLSASRYIANISTYPDFITYTIDYNEKSYYNYNQYFFSSMAKNILH